MQVEELIPAVTAVLLAIGAVAGFAAAILAFKYHRRLSRKDRTVWIGSAFDTNLIAQQLSQVRRDYIVALHRRPHPRFHPATLLAAARQSLSRLAYFKAQEPQATERGKDSEA
jgi:hypothetical protein